MAGDTRESASNPHADIPPTPPSSNLYETFNAPPEPSGPPPPPVVGKVAETNEKYGLKDGIKTIRWQDFKDVYMYPCVRDGGITGIGVGAGVGGLRALFGATIWKSCNWAVGATILSAIASYEICSYKRKYEKTLIKRAVEIQERKKVDVQRKRKEIMEMREKKRMEEEEEERKRRSWWKVW